MARSQFFRLTVATPATLLAGVRAATATVVPIAAAALTGNAALVWTALGGWLSTFADTGGAYRSRARALGTFAVAGAVSVAVAALAARSPWLAVPLVFVWACGGAMLRLWGDTLASLGNLLAVSFVASLAAPTDARGAAMRAAYFLIGCVGAMLLTLLVWPLRPWMPARRAVAACYEALASLARGVGAALDEAPQGGTPWHELALREHANVRRAIETARITMGETRRSRIGSSQRSDDLVVLLETADLLFEALVATAEAVETSARAAGDARLHAASRAAADAVADELSRIAARIPVPSRWNDEGVAHTRTIDRAVLALWETVESMERAQQTAPAMQTTHTSAASLAHATQAAALLEHTVTLAAVAADAVGSLVEARPDRGPRPEPTRRLWRVRAASVLGTLRANLTPDSLVLRHATRAGVVAALATTAAYALDIPHASWVTTTALIVLQPYVGTTRRRGLERTAWTALGAIVAAVLAALVRDRLVIAAIMFPLSAASIAVRAAHYGLFTFFLTPVFVLLAEPATGDWRLAAVRSADTLIGGIVALVATRVLWPSWEHRRLPSDLATMIDAAHRYFRAVEWKAVGDAPSTPQTLAAARRRVGLAANNADAAFQRFVAEPPGPLTDVESLMTLLTFVRRLTGAATVLAMSGAPPTTPERTTLARAIDATLADVVTAVREERAPAPLADVVARYSRTRGEGVTRDPRALRTTQELPVGGVGLERVARQAGVLHAAASRAFGSGDAAA